MDRAVCKPNRSLSGITKAAEFLFAIIVLFVGSLPLFSQAAEGTILEASLIRRGAQ